MNWAVASIPQLSLATLLLLCLASFSWAMRNFFTRPTGTTPGMKAIAVCGVLFALLHLFAILFSSISLAGGIAAALLYSASLGLFWWAIRTSLHRPLSASFSLDCPAHLVQDGPYRFIRHPLYCSYLLTWTAACIASARLFLLPTVAAMAAIYVVAARAEERKFLESPLADSYRHYRARTGRLFPNVVKIVLALSSRSADNGRLGSFRNPA